MFHLLNRTSSAPCLGARYCATPCNIYEAEQAAVVVMSTPPPRHQQQHLYLVVEGSEDEYSIHKIDVHEFDPDDTDDLDWRLRPLPDPLLRVPGERNNAMCFVAHGAKILAMPPSPGRAGLALDTARTMTITAGPLPQTNDQGLCHCSLVSVGDRLYSMDKRNNFEVLRFGSTSSCSSSSSRCWSWSSVPSQPPFNPLYVACYAVHPDGRTVFFSVSSHYLIHPPLRRPRGDGGDDNGATFSFDTEAARWTFRGYWRLPFHGQAHYDIELDAWVGLHNECDCRGRVSCCDVVPPATGDESVDRREQAPPWKLARDRLFRVKGKRHSGGALVYMGSSTFCLVERAAKKGEIIRQPWKRMDGPPRQLLYVRTFGLKYGKTGRLCIATCGRRARCYALPEGTSCDEMFMSLRALWV